MGVIVKISFLSPAQGNRPQPMWAFPVRAIHWQQANKNFQLGHTLKNPNQKIQIRENKINRFDDTYQMYWEIPQNKYIPALELVKE